MAHCEPRGEKRRDPAAAASDFQTVPRCLLAFALFIGSGGLLRPSRAQQPSTPQSSIRSTAELVKIDVGVLDKHGEYIAGLTQNDFRVLDNSGPAAITYFAPIEAAARVAVIVETSPAVYLIQNQHLAAAYALLQGLRAEDEIALIAYDRAPRPLLSFTSDKSALVEALSQLQYSLGSAQLNLFDSVSTSLDWLAPALGKKAIVLLSTGLDSSPSAHWETLVSKLRANDVVIYPVALGGSLRWPVKKAKQSKSKSKVSRNSEAASAETSAAEEDESPLSFQKADAALNSLAAITGGQAYFPNSGQDFARIYGEIATALRHQYVLGVTPAHDGQVHAISVEVLDNAAVASALAPANTPAAAQPAPPARTGLRIFHRQSYLAPAP